MFSLLDIQIPPPTIWQHFETLCWDIFGEVYGLSNTQKIGRPGQSQSGVDIVCFANSEGNWIGIQCKEKGTYPSKSFTEGELRSAVEEVKKFKPPLFNFIIATTAPRDEKIQTIAREITEENTKNGLFSVRVYFWNDFEDLLRKYPDIYQKYYSSINEILSRSENQKYELKEKSSQSEIPLETGSIHTIQQSALVVNANEIIQSTLSLKYREDLDIIKKYLDSNKPSTVLELIQSLKQRIWTTALPDIKYRILTYEGAARLQLSEYPEAGRKLIEALQYNSDDEKALGNAAMGYHLNQNYIAAIDYASKVLEKNPLSAYAYQVIILSQVHSQPIESIISTIPTELIHTSDISGAIGQCYFNSEQFEEASYWLEIALNNAKENAFSIKALFASSLINKVKNDKKILKGLQISKDIRTILERSIILIDEVINIASNDINLQKAHVGWLIERSIAKRLLGDLEGSSLDLTEAFRLDPKNPLVLFHKGLIELELGNYPNAEKHFKQVLWEDTTPGVLWTYLYSLKIQKKYDEGIEKISEFKQLVTNRDKEDVLNYFLIEFYLEKGKDFYGNAESVALLRYENDKSDVSKAVELVRVYRITGKDGEILKIIEEVKSINIELLPASLQHNVADMYYYLNHYVEAAEIYDRIVDPTINSPLTQKMIASFYFGGDHKRALDLCRELHSNQGPLPYSSSIELTIYQEIGDLSESRRICQQYLERYPDDYEMRLNQARVNLLTNKIQDVESFLKIPIEFDKLTYVIGSKLVDLNYCVKNFDEAIRLSYKLRNKFKKLPEAHLAYINLLMNIEDRSTIINKPEMIDIDSIVELEDNFHQTNTYLVCNLDNSDIITNKLQIDSPLGQKVIGKRDGDKIVLESLYGENILVIKKLVNKFVFAFQDSANNFNQRFPGHSGLYRIPFGTGPDGKIIDEDIKKIVRLAEKNQKNIDYIIDLYKKNQLPIGTVAKTLNRDIFSTCSHLTLIPETGIQSFIRQNKNDTEYLSIFKSNPRIIIDPIAVFTLNCLDIGDTIVKKYGKFGIALSTVCMLQDFILDLSGKKTRGYLQFGSINGSVAFDKVTPEQIQKLRQHYEKLLSWVNTNCDVLPCYPALSLNYNERKKYNSLFGIAFVDSMLLASQPGMILYSDDGLLHHAAQQLFGINSVWTQLLIQNLLSDQNISRDQFDEYAIKLLQLHYYPPTLDALILIKSADKAQWQLAGPFLDGLRILGDQRLDLDTSIRIGIEFTILLWMRCQDFEARGLLLLKLLNVLISRRERSEVLGIFTQTTMINNKLSDESKEEILGIIKIFNIIYS